MKTLRTPDERFENLPGYPYEPNYIEVPDGEGGSLRIHYVDEGRRDAEPVLRAVAFSLAAPDAPAEDRTRARLGQPAGRQIGPDRQIADHRFAALMPAS